MAGMLSLSRRLTRRLKSSDESEDQGIVGHSDHGEVRLKQTWSDGLHSGGSLAATKTSHLVAIGPDN